MLIPLNYKNIRPLGTLRFAVENTENKVALFEDAGKPITDFSIDSISSFNKGFATIYQDHLEGLIDRNGVVRLEVKYQSIHVDAEGKVFTQLPNEWSFVSEKNETIRQITVDEVKPVDESRFVVCQGKVCGVVTGELKPVIPIQYGNLAGIETGKYFAKRNSKMGVIAENGEVIVPFKQKFGLAIAHQGREKINGKIL